MIHVGPDTEALPNASDISSDQSKGVSVRSKRNKSRTQSKPKGEPHLQGAAAADAGGYVAETDSFPDNPPPHEASSAMAGAIAAASAGSAEAALRSVLSWISLVLTSLKQMEWTQIGYQVKPDGSQDLARPLHSIPDPNELIRVVLEKYSGEVVNNLHVLLRHIEAQGTGAADPSLSRAGDSDADDASEAPAGASHNMPAGGAALPPDLGSFSSIGLLAEPGLGPPSTSISGLLSGGVSGSSSAGDGHLCRQVSSLYVGQGLESVSQGLARPALPRLGSEAWVASHPLAGAGSTGSNSSSDPDPAEQRVSHVIAKMYYSRSMGVAIGFPAFDSRQQLVGFYSEQKVGAETRIAFIPESRLAGLDKSDTTAASDILNEEIEQKSLSVHTLSAYQNNLEKLKENVMMYYWSKDVVFDLKPDAT